MAKYKVDLLSMNTSDLKTIKNKEMKDLLHNYNHTKDEALKEMMVMGNLKLVLSLVSRFNKRCDNLDDLFQVGVIGLIKAIENFDISLEVSFSTYAVPLILGEMKRYLRENSMIKVSRTLKDIGYLVLTKREEYSKKEGKEINDEQLSELLQIPIATIHDAINALTCVTSMQEHINEDEEYLSLEHRICDKHNEMDYILDKIALADALKQLNQKELWLLHQRYDLDKSQSEIAEELKISQASVSRNEKNIIMHLRKLLS